MRVYRFNSPDQPVIVNGNGCGGAVAAGAELNRVFGNSYGSQPAYRLLSALCYYIPCPEADGLPYAPEWVCALLDRHLVAGLNRFDDDPDESTELYLPSGILHVYDVPDHRISVGGHQVLVPADALRRS